MYQINCNAWGCLDMLLHIQVCLWLNLFLPSFTVSISSLGVFVS